MGFVDKSKTVQTSESKNTRETILTCWVRMVRRKMNGANICGNSYALIWSKNLIFAHFKASIVRRVQHANVGYLEAFLVIVYKSKTVQNQKIQYN